MTITINNIDKTLSRHIAKYFEGFTCSFDRNAGVTTIEYTDRPVDPVEYEEFVRPIWNSIKTREKVGINYDLADLTMESDYKAITVSIKELEDGQDVQ